MGYLSTNLIINLLITIVLSSIVLIKSNLVNNNIYDYFLQIKNQNNIYLIKLYKIWLIWVYNIIETISFIRIYIINIIINKQHIKFNKINLIKKVYKLNDLLKKKLIYIFKFKKIKFNKFNKIKNILISPLNKLKIQDNLLSKYLIRKSKFFNKTKYSFIRQECKNIVNMTLLMNMAYITIVFNVYMKFNLSINFIPIYIYIYIIINIILIYKIYNIFNNFKQNIFTLI